jgi:predicted Ser/Thr protein kinase
MNAGDICGAFSAVEKLGAGGFGEVWKAWDSRLNRWVALKLLTAVDDEELARFRREAQVAGRLTHPGIAAIYEIAEDRGRPFIAMQFVDGRTLRTWKGPPREAALLLRDAARAVHFAHEQGVIHRDLKPDNLMLDAAGRVYVMDFGLARQLSGPDKLTLSGMIVGTPAYMCPEQARGERVDARADVYSLGATLYDLLCGHAPFSGDSVYDIVLRVLEEDPAPLPPSIDPELAAVVFKCLEKDPARRYATAGEVADDLERWVAGETVVARPAGALRRLSKAVSRRRALVVAAAAGLAAVAVAALGGLWLLGRSQAGLEAARERLSPIEDRLTGAQRDLIRQLRETSAAALDAALDLRRVGNVAAMRRQAARVEELCERVAREVPSLGEPHYRLGRVYRILLRPQEALAAQDEALRKEPGLWPARYERVVLLSKRYRQRLHELVAEDWRAQGERLARDSGGALPAGARLVEPATDTLGKTDPVAVALHRSLTRDLAELRSAPLRGGPRAVVRGLEAWLRDDGGAAREQFRQALDLDEAVEALASLEENDGRLEEALRICFEGLARDAGCLPMLIQAAHARGRLGVRHPENAGRHMAESLADFDRAVAMDGESVEARVMRARARLALAYHRPDPAGARTLREGAIEDFSEVLTRHPGLAEAWAGRAAGRAGLALALENQGEDARQLCRDAIADYEKALGLEPGLVRAWRGLGDTRQNLAGATRLRGGTPGNLEREAAGAFDQAVKLDPGDAANWVGRAEVWLQIASYTSGAESDEAFRRAVEDCTAAVSRDPKDWTAWNARGTVRGSWALRRTYRGEDARALYAEALADHAEALKLNAVALEPWLKRSITRGNAAADAYYRGEDPSELYRGAVADAEEALRLAPEHFQGWMRRGLTRQNWAATAGATLHEQAIADFSEALKRNPASDECWQLRALARINLGLGQAGTGADPTAHFEAALADAEEALRRNPKRARSWSTRGLARFNLGVRRHRAGGDPSTLFEAAIADQTEAIRADDEDAEGWARRGFARHMLAVWRGSRGGNPEADYAGAREDYAAAVQRNGTRADWWMERGQALLDETKFLETRGQNLPERLEAAVLAFTQALERRAPRLRALQARGEARASWAMALWRSGQEPLGEFARAVEDLDPVIEAEAKNALAHRIRGIARYYRGLYLAGAGQDAVPDRRAALADLEEAARLDGSMAPQLSKVIEELRKQVP